MRLLLRMRARGHEQTGGALPRAFRQDRIDPSRGAHGGAWSAPKLRRELVALLAAEVATVLAQPEVARTLAGWPVEPSAESPESFARLVTDECRRCRDTVAAMDRPIE